MIDALLAWYLKRARHPLKDKIVGRYWSRFAARPLWIAYDGDLRFKADLRDYVQQKVFFDGYYEPDLVAWLKRHLGPDDVFWDVGANVGAITLVAAKSCRRVFAFEPEPAARARLEEHVAANGLRNVTIVPFALSSTEGVARFVLGPPSNSGMHSLVRGAAGAQSIEVRTATADCLVDAGTVDPPSVLKVDVEGAELMVFQGAGALLRGAQLTRIVFEARGDEGSLADAELAALLRGHDFEVSHFGGSDPAVVSDMTNFVAIRKPAS